MGTTPDTAAAGRPRVALIGGPDVDARLPLMDALSDEFELVALGSERALVERFAARGYAYEHYPLDRSVNPLADVRTVRALTRTLRDVAPQLVHTFDTKPGVFGCIAARRARVPHAVCTVTGLGSLYSARGIKTAVLRSIYQALQRAASKRADVTVFQNHDDRAQLVAARIVVADRTEVILGSGVDTDRFDPAAVPPERAAAVRADLGLPADATVVTMIARVTRTKGVLEFAEAARAVAARHPDARFLLVGPDDEGSLDRLRPDELDRVRAVVTWPGARPDVEAVLAASDVFVLPTAYREGIPRVLLEAAAMGLPIVTTDSPGCNEVVVPGRNGVLLASAEPRELGAAIAQLVADPDSRRRFGAESRERAVRLFDLRRVAEQTRALYRRLLSRSVPAADRR